MKEDFIMTFDKFGIILKLKPAEKYSKYLIVSKIREEELKFFLRKYNLDEDPDYIFNFIHKMTPYNWGFNSLLSEYHSNIKHGQMLNAEELYFFDGRIRPYPY